MTVVAVGSVAPAAVLVAVALAEEETVAIPATVAVAVAKEVGEAEWEAAAGLAAE